MTQINTVTCQTNWSPMQIGVMHDNLPSFTQNPSSITGPNSLCSLETGVFSVPFISGVTYDWVVTGTGWSILSGQGTSSVTIQSGTNSTGIVSVSYCDGYRKPKIVPLTAATITGLDYICLNETQTYTTDVISGSIYSWTVPSGVTIQSGQGTNQIQVTANSSYYDGNINVIITHPICTAYGTKYTYKAICNMMSGTLNQSNNVRLSIYPNPSVSVLFLENNDNVKIDKIIARNLLTNQKEVLSLVGNEVDVKTLRNGSYLLEISTENGTFINRFIKK